MSGKVSIIIPNYNESNNLNRGVLTHISDYLESQNISYEVIISDDGSTDESLSLIEEFVKSHPRFRILKNHHAGKPFALRSGIEKAKGEYVLFTDMDQSTPISELPKLLAWTKEYNIIIGSRGRRRDSAWYRQIISLGFWFVRKSIILPDITDTQCGFKLLNIKSAKKIFSKMQIFNRDERATGWKVTAYDVEMLYIAKLMGEKIKEVRVKWKDEDTSVEKGRNFVKESIDMLKEILRVRINSIRGLYA